MIGTHHILDGGTREKAIKETVPVPEDMGEDEVPDDHRCQEIVGTQERGPKESSRQIGPRTCIEMFALHELMKLKRK